MNPYDVIVLGLGGMGSSAAYHLAARGQRVLGLERHGPAHDLGSSHGGSRIVRQSYFEDPAYVPLLQRAYDLWDKLARDSGRDVVTITGGIYLGGERSTTFAGSLRAAREWNLPHEVLEPAQIRRRFPTLAPDPGVLGLYEELGGLARPELTVTAHLDLAARAGADLHFTEPALSWTADPAGDGVEVVTAAGRHRASRLVIAPGSWAPAVLADLGLPLVVERQVMYWFDPAGGVGPYLPERHPVYIWEAPDTTQIYGFPAIDGPAGGAKVAFFRRGVPCTPDTIDRTVHDAETADMRAYTRPRLPTLPGPLLHAATCMYTTTPDEHFVVAAHPRHPQVTVACGFSGHGFKFVPVVGEILADLAIDGRTDHPVALFDPLREFAR